MTDPASFGADLTTAQAAAFCTQLGKPTSRRVLEKYRGRQPGDPGEHGPDYWRDDIGHCWYPRASLVKWVDAWRARRRFRALASVPTNFADRQRPGREAA